MPVPPAAGQRRASSTGSPASPAALAPSPAPRTVSPRRAPSPAASRGAVAPSLPGRTPSARRPSSSPASSHTSVRAHVGVAQPSPAERAQPQDRAPHEIEALQQALRDVQVVLTSHERELEGLWARRREIPEDAVAELAALRRDTALLKRTATGRAGSEPQDSGMSERIAKLERRQEESLRLQREQLEQLEQAQARDRGVLQELAADLRRSREGRAPSGSPGDPAALRGLGELVQRQRCEVELRLQRLQTDSDEQGGLLRGRLQEAEAAVHRLEGMVHAVHADQEDVRRTAADLRTDFAAMCADLHRAQDDTRAGTLAVAEQCGQGLERSIAELRAQLQQSDEAGKERFHVAAERAQVAARAGDVLRGQVENNLSQIKRLQAQMQEMEAERREETRRQQQAMGDATTRLQLQCAADVRKLQKEVESEGQRQDDATTALYRVVEELRAVQQRTLDEYHRQGDEFARAQARFQQAVAETAASVKEDLQQELERISQTVATEHKALSDALSRARADATERIAGHDRRVAELEQQLDAHRARLRALESVDVGSVAAAAEDSRRRLQDLEGCARASEVWRQECAARVAAAETKMQDAGDARQIQGLQRRIDALEQGLALARGAERDELRRTLRQEVAEAKLASERAVDQLQQALDSLKRSLTQAQQQLKDDLKAVERDAEQQRAAAGPALAPQVDGLQARLSALQSEVSKLGPMLRSELEGVRAGLHKEAARAVEEAGGASKKCDELRESVRPLAKLEPRLASLAEKVDALAQLQEKLVSMGQFMEDLDHRHEALHQEFLDLQDEHQQSSRGSGDKLRGLEAEVARIGGYVDKMASTQDAPIKELAERTGELERMVQAELTRTRRSVTHLEQRMGISAEGGDQGS